MIKVIKMMIQKEMDMILLEPLEINWKIIKYSNAKQF